MATSTCRMYHLRSLKRLLYMYGLGSVALDAFACYSILIPDITRMQETLVSLVQ